MSSTPSPPTQCWNENLYFHLRNFCRSNAPPTKQNRSIMTSQHCDGGKGIEIVFYFACCFHLRKICRQQYASLFQFRVYNRVQLLSYVCIDTNVTIHWSIHFNLHLHVHVPAERTLLHSACFCYPRISHILLLKMLCRCCIAAASHR